MEKQELGLSNRLRGKEVLDENIAKMRKEVTSFTELIKVSVERGIMTSLFCFTLALSITRILTIKSMKERPR